MFLDDLWLLKRAGLVTYLEKWDFSWYDFLVEKDNIKNWRDLLSFLDLFIEYKCFGNNNEILTFFIDDIFKTKSKIIIIETILLNTDNDIKNLIWKYNYILTKDFFKFDWINELFEKSRDIINNEWTDIIIYNSINNFLLTIDEKEYFNFLLELLDSRNIKYFEEVELIFGFMPYTSNNKLSNKLNDIVYYFLSDYNIEETLDDKYSYSISYLLINALSDRRVDYKMLFIKNMFNYLWKKDFYEKFNKEINNEVKELLFKVILAAINKNTNNIKETIFDIKKSLIEDKKRLNNIVKNFKKDFEYKEHNDTNNFIESLINEI